MSYKFFMPAISLMGADCLKDAGDQVGELGFKKALIEKNKLLNLISELTIEEQDVLRAKYIDGLRWEYIPGKINISRAKCFYLHKIAVNRLINIWNESVD